MSALKELLEPASDTQKTCPVRFPLQPSCCPTARTDPYIKLASACLGTERTGPFRYRSSREKFLNNRVVRLSATKMRKRVRHFDENSANALVDTWPSATRIGNLHPPSFRLIVMVTS